MDEADIPFEVNMETKRRGQQPMKRTKESEVVGRLPRFLIFRPVKFPTKKIPTFLCQTNIVQHEKQQITIYHARIDSLKL